VEREGPHTGASAEAQSRGVALLTRVLAAHLPLCAGAAHCDIAPGRKRDRGARFAWRRFLAALAQY
jgi:AmpD protein